jgi:hypothetical protein
MGPDLRLGREPRLGSDPRLGRESALEWSRHSCATGQHVLYLCSGNGRRVESRDRTKEASTVRIDGAMTTEFLVHMGSPGGAAVRRQLAGTRYSLLPDGPSRCPWHRTFDGTLETASAAAPPRCESSEAWPSIEVREEALEGLPRHQLPDTRRVVFVPHVNQFGTVLRSEWSLIKQAATVAHRTLIRHAYEVSLEILRCWKKYGPRILQTVHERDRRIREGIAFVHPDLPLTDIERWLPSWVSVHAPHLTYKDASDPYYVGDRSVDEKQVFDRRMTELVPNVEARVVMSRATGYGLPAIKKAVELARRGLAGRRLRR